MSGAPEEAWKEFATIAAGRDPGATIGARAHREAQEARVDDTLPAPHPAVTVPTLPVLPVAHGEAPGDVDFVVSGVLGEGGMGRVLLARQRSLKRDVAIKVLRSDAAPREVIDGLLAEAVVTGSLEHPNVVPVHALGLDTAGRPVLVMKRIEGVSLRDLARDRGHPAWAAIAADQADRRDAEIEILTAVCNALHFAHARGIAHRDVKLDNIMIGSFGEVYVVDWGIASRIGGEARRGQLVGTPAYMAPEMVRCEPADARTDVYLVGATLHALLTGAPRHGGEAMHEVLYSALESAPFAYGPEVPAELAAILHRAMRPKREDRFATALELRHALAAFRRHRGSIALADEAAGRLAELRALGPDADARRAHVRLTEARFGFTAALKAWQENAAARAGLGACLGLMIEHEIAQRDLEGARDLLAELTEPCSRPDLAARADALEADLAAEKERAVKLAALERDRDLRVGGGVQLAIVGFLPLAAIVFGIYIHGRGLTALSPVELLGGPAVAFMGLAAARILVRRRLTTEISRKALSMLLLVAGVALAHRALVFAAGASLDVIVIGDGLIAVAVLGAMAINIEKRMGWAAVPLVATSLAIPAFPQHAVPIFGAGLVPSLIILVLAWRRAVRA